MSSQDQVDHETVPLIRPGRRRVRLGFSPETLLIPIVFATTLANLLPSTTIVEVIRQTVCRLSNIPQSDPSGQASSVPTYSDLCDAPDIVQSFSAAMAVFGVADGIMSIVGCGILSRFSSRYGRRPALLFIIVAETARNCLMLGLQYTPGWLIRWTLFAAILCHSFSGQALYHYLTGAYIVDVCAPEERTAALSKVGGWTALGSCISLALGGSITTRTGNPFIVFYIAASILLLSSIYVASVLPESFPMEKRSALSSTQPERPTRTVTIYLAPLLHILAPLKVLIPTPKAGGTRNWRLTWCALHHFMFVTANAYAASAWLVLATSIYGFTPADTGLFFTFPAVSATVTLAVLVPLLVRLLRPYYSRRTVCLPPVDEDMTHSEVMKQETSDRLDVHLAIASCVIAAVSFLGAAASTTKLALIVSGIFIGCSMARLPAVRSLAVGSVDPLKQGEALAALEMVSSVGGVLSPILMGSILTATINTAPLLLFYVHLVAVLASGVVLLLVRDEDRYRSSGEMSNDL